MVGTIGPCLNSLRLVRGAVNSRVIPGGKPQREAAIVLFRAWREPLVNSNKNSTLFLVDLRQRSMLQRVHCLARLCLKATRRNPLEEALLLRVPPDWYCGKRRRETQSIDAIRHPRGTPKRRLSSCPLLPDGTNGRTGYPYGSFSLQLTYREAIRYLTQKPTLP